MMAVEPRSGWPITSKDIMNNRNNGFKKLLSEFISDILLTEYPEIYRIKLNLQISEGCILIGPILIHLILPFTLVPTSGIKRIIKRIMLNNINIQSDLKRKSDGNIKKSIIENSPTEINNACLLAKWKGLEVISSAIYMLDEVTMTKPITSNKPNGKITKMSLLLIFIYLLNA